MTRKVRGGADVFQVPSAPDWRPAPPGALRELRAEARALTRAALEAQDPGLACRALSVRSELRVTETVRLYTPPVLDPSGPMPFGPARGGLDHVEIAEVAYDPRTGRDELTSRVVRKRRGPEALSGFGPQVRRAAEAYADLVAAMASSPGSCLAGPGRGGISDGGATTRCALAARLREARAAIGMGLVLSPRGHDAHADRARRAVTCIDLVDAVCLRGHSLRRVLADHGWSRWHNNEARLTEALKAALGRLAAAL
jgi:hypothetical protein